MKVISTGSKFDIYPDDLKSFERLPANYYVVRFHPKKGFYLEKYTEFQMTESKIYGIHLEKVHKVLKSFEAFNRNLGVILSGDKGIGKSLFARLLGREAVNNGMPVIIVEGFVEGIGSFIDSIDQEVLVLFDEFDKTFASGRDDGVDPQASMLSLFDGVAQGKKLFVVTCNELRGLNGFLVNRPGRFHYHFRFEYPSAEDIRNYLKDKLIPETQSEIEEVVNFSKRVALNFDCLRAIAFELNLGQDFSGAISDLNIINVEKERYRVTAKFADGTTLVNKDFYMDSFNEEDKNVYLYNCQDHYFYNQNRERLSLDECDNHIILLGDVGCNFALTGQLDYKFKMELSQLPFTYICLCGNHEARVAVVMERNPKRWESVQKYGGEVYVEKEFPRIEYLSDAPAIYDFSGYRTLSFPGAYSIDKWYRLARHWTWYEDEQLTEAEMQSGRELVEREGKIDLVISHTCPLIYEPRDLFLAGIDQSMVDKSMERYLGEIEFDLDYRRWAFGHFHADRLFPWNDGKQMLMLFNENVVDLKKFMEMKEGDSLQEILA